jgi:predicted phage replisome organizer
MADIKWIKLSVNMFDDEKIKLIKTMPEGDKIIVIWVQLLCLAGKVNDGGLVYMGQNMAYTDEMFATLFDEKTNIVRIALQTLEQFGMIEMHADGKVDVINWEKHQSTDKLARTKQQNRLRQQKYYYRTKLREIGVEVDKVDLPDDPEKLKEILEELEEKPNVSLTLANGTEVRSKKLDVRGKKKEVNSSHDSAKAKYDDDSPYMKLAKRLFEHIKQRNPKQKEPTWQTWADDFRKTVELDNREVDEVTKVLDWSQQDDFWQNNVLSPAKFRKQYDQLYLKMKNNTGYGGNSYGGLEF